MTQSQPPAQSGRLALDYTALSDRGLVRTNNEDSAVAAPNLLALADGMGGHAAGEVASELMITSLYSLQNTMSQGVQVPHEQLLTMLAEAMDDGNRDIAAHVDDNPAQEGMGCTLTTLLFDGESLGVCHVGDSRGYLLRDGELTQITKDDTFVQSLVDEGKLAPEDVSSHPQRSLILKALNGHPVDPTLELRDARAGDRYMLCSDGLSDPVSFDTIQEVLRSGTPTEAGSQLINLALRGGGPDNVTVVVADVVDIDHAVAEAEANGAPAPTLPTGPALAGAVNGTAPELPRPDTSAGRASAVQIIRQPNGSTAAAASAAGGDEDGSAEPDGDDASDAEESDDPERKGRKGRRGKKGGKSRKGRGGRKSRRGLYITLAAVLVLVVAAGSTLWYVRNSLNESYFVAVAAGDDKPSPATTSQEQTPAPAGDAGASTAAAPADAAPTDGATDDATESASPIIIYQGSPGSILGFSTQDAYQEVCLNENADVQLLSAGSDEPCHRFSTADLTPAARGTLDNLPTDSYEEVQMQVRRLAEQTLPVCVTREDGNNGGNNDRGSNGSDRGNSSEDTDPSDLTTPGVSCREVN
jgi:serine/threonine protein phosphatase PrpC